MLLLITECNFTKKEIFAANFPNKSSKRELPMKLYNNLICMTSQTFFNEALYESSKISPLCHLVPVHGCYLAFLPDNCIA